MAGCHGRPGSIARIEEITKALKRSPTGCVISPSDESLADTPTILLAGEIFVRHDNISRQSLLETLAGRGFAAKVSTVLEWIYYTDWCFQKGFTPYQATMKDRISLFFRNATMKRYEKAFRRALSRIQSVWR